MYQAPLPKEYADLSPEEADARIIAAKAKLGSRLVILGHHYQRDEIIKHADYRGDSYKLAKDANKHPEADYIVFCGVHFMAESADILTPDYQIVILPNLAAGCSMVRKCWAELERVYATSKVAVGAGASEVRSEQSPVRVVPVTYINSAANLKAFVGEHGGTVCTSTNAPTAVTWALQQGDKVLFFPDQHLGRNTGVKLGFDPDEDMVVWDPYKPLGGNTEESLIRAKFILWKGHCSVHKRFTVEQILKARADYPGINVLVHPECPIDVVRASDYNGSTEFIIKTVEAAEPGTTWAIGTELNLVQRLARTHPDKNIVFLDRNVCYCSTMNRIDLPHLVWALENLVAGTVVNQITVDPDTEADALVALQRMLDLPGKSHRD